MTFHELFGTIPMVMLMAFVVFELVAGLISIVPK